MIILQDIGDQLAWECDCVDPGFRGVCHLVDEYSIVALWCEVLEHVATTHRRVMLDLCLGTNVLALTKQFFGTAQVMKLTFHSPVEVPDDGVLTDPR